jgi:hypothetical protein
MMSKLPSLLKSTYDTFSVTFKGSRNINVCYGIKNIKKIQNSQTQKLPNIDWDQLDRENNFRRSTGLNYLMGVDDE